MRPVSAAHALGACRAAAVVGDVDPDVPGAEPLLAPVIRVAGRRRDRLRPADPTVIVSYTTPDDVPAGGVYTFVRSPCEAAEVAIGLPLEAAHAVRQVTPQ